MSRGSIEKFLVETVSYVFTDITLLFGQPQHKAGLRVTEKVIFEIASHLNQYYLILQNVLCSVIKICFVSNS